MNELNDKLKPLAHEIEITKIFLEMNEELINLRSEVDRLKTIGDNLFRAAKEARKSQFVITEARILEARRGDCNEYLAQAEKFLLKITDDAIEAWSNKNYTHKN